MNVGAAEIDITPDFPVDLSGYAARLQPAVGVLEPIFARAMFLDDGDEKLLWIAADVIAFDRRFVEEFREWAERELHLQSRQVLLTATHTHFAPATINLSACGEYSAAYIDFLRPQLRQVAREAMKGQTPCDVVSASAPLNLAVDRRKKPSSHVDPVVSALGFRRDDGTFAAAVVNYAMHPVSYGHGERRISPDWCGTVASAVSEALRGAPITLVTNGAAGNINPPATDQPPEVVIGYGRQIAETAVGALRSAKPQAARLLLRSLTVPVPLEWHDADDIDRIADDHIARMNNFVWGEQFRIALNCWRESMKRTVAAGGGREVPIEIQAIRIGGVTIVAVNGEMFTRFTELLRRRTTQNLFVIAYANSAFGYIAPRDAYLEGGYEVETAHFFYNSFRPQIGGLELFADRAVALIQSLDHESA
jgi:hypothetical protein